MNREIKFRAWEKSKCRMLFWPGHCDLAFVLRDEGYEVMQYTDLKDRNGKEIYEGDVVKSIDFGVQEVRWDVTGFNIVDSYTDNGGGDCAPIVEKVVYQVIGNIYENPGLMEAK